jgi:hypothetical protein
MIGDLRSWGCGATFLSKVAKLRLRKCFLLVAELRLWTQKKSCACPPLVDNTVLYVHNTVSQSSRAAASHEELKKCTRFGDWRRSDIQFCGLQVLYIIKQLLLLYFGLLFSANLGLHPTGYETFPPRAALNTETAVEMYTTSNYWLSSLKQAEHINPKMKGRHLLVDLTIQYIISGSTGRSREETDPSRKDQSIVFTE